MKPYSVVAATVLAAALGAQSADPRLTVADVEKATGLKGIQQVAPGSVPGAGGGLNFAGPDKGLNFAGPDKHMVVMVNFGTADLYRRARAQTEMKVGGQTIPMPLFHADVKGIGDEAFDSPPGSTQYVLYVRKGSQAISVTTYLRVGSPKPVLTMDQLKAIAGVVVSRM
jgi:hypothetical protein